MKTRMKLTITPDCDSTWKCSLVKGRGENHGAVFADTIETLIGTPVPHRKYQVEWRISASGEFVLQGARLEEGFGQRIHRINGDAGDWATLCIFPKEWEGRTLTRRVVKIW